MTTRRSSFILALGVAILLALGGTACGDDGDGEGTPRSTAPSTTDGDETSTPEEQEEGDDTTTTSEEPDGTTTTEPDGTTTTEPDGTSGGALLSRIPDIEGFDSEPNEDGDGFGDELCGGGTPSVEPVEEGAVAYSTQEDVPSGFFGIFGMRFASEAEASTYYEEFTSTTSGCTDEDLTVDEGADSDIGDAGRIFTLDFVEGDDGTLYVSLRGDEVWLLTQLSGAIDLDPGIDAFRTAIEG